MAQYRDNTLLEAQKSKLKPPSMFKVMLLNDDYNQWSSWCLFCKNSST